MSAVERLFGNRTGRFEVDPDEFIAAVEADMTPEEFAEDEVFRQALTAALERALADPDQGEGDLPDESALLSDLEVRRVGLDDAFCDGIYAQATRSERAEMDALTNALVDAVTKRRAEPDYSLDEGHLPEEPLIPDTETRTMAIFVPRRNRPEGG